MGVEKRKIRRRQTREYPEPIGRITIECVDQAITGLWFEGQAHYGAGRRDFIEEDAPAIQAGFEWLDRYFAGKRPGPDELTLDPKGTDFQLKVWSELCCLDYGETTADEIYSRVAENTESGDIILLHCGTEHTAEALPRILDTLTEKYELVTVSELIYKDNYVIDHAGRQSQRQLY